MVHIQWILWQIIYLCSSFMLCFFDCQISYSYHCEIARLISLCSRSILHLRYHLPRIVFSSLLISSETVKNSLQPIFLPFLTISFLFQFFSFFSWHFILSRKGLLSTPIAFLCFTNTCLQRDMKRQGTKVDSNVRCWRSSFLTLTVLVQKMVLQTWQA